MHISARADYAMRALLTLAGSVDERVKLEALAAAQALPPKFLEQVLTDLRRAGVVIGHRGTDGGYSLARAAGEITLADVLRAVDGPLAEVRGLRPEDAVYQGSAEHLREIWVAVRASLRAVLEAVTLADVVAGRLPPEVAKFVDDPAAWVSHPVAG